MSTRRPTFDEMTPAELEAFSLEAMGRVRPLRMAVPQGPTTLHPMRCAATDDGKGTPVPADHTHICIHPARQPFQYEGAPMHLCWCGFEWCPGIKPPKAEPPRLFTREEVLIIVEKVGSADWRDWGLSEFLAEVAQELDARAIDSEPPPAPARCSAIHRPDERMKGFFTCSFGAGHAGPHISTGGYTWTNTAPREATT